MRYVDLELRRPLAILGLCAASFLLGCDGETMAEEDGGAPPFDAGVTEGMDGGPERPSCGSDEACDDGAFCNGSERCAPEDPAADDRGCVAGSEPCGDGEMCDEGSASCLPECVDADGDGHRSIECGGDDCDDTDPNRYPGNVEICDGAAHDEDCNLETFGFLDADGDGAGSAMCCNVLPDGELGCGTDCNDSDSTVHPRAGDGPPLYCDGVDNDCDGVADEGCPCTEGESRECGGSEQLDRVGTCEPGTQVCSGGTWTEMCTGGRRPEEEFCDERDNDCDGTVDEAVLRTYYRDEDGDGFGVVEETTLACSPPPGWARDPGDCDDARPTVNTLAAEACNGVDDDCDGTLDEGVTTTYHLDMDGDRFGSISETTEACTPPEGYVADSTDCDDTRRNVNPPAAEICDGIDNSCDGSVDLGCSCTEGDTQPCGSTDVGACRYGTQRCVGGTWAECVGSVEPSLETCDGVDEDCDGTVDDGVGRTYYLDADGDGFGTDAMTRSACTEPEGYSTSSADCDDTTRSVSPAAVERCNGVDDDCDGVIDPGCDCTEGQTQPCGAGDGSGGILATGQCEAGTQRCIGGLWGECVGSVAPTTETCNTLDDDCDGSTDEEVTRTYHLDEDGDGFGGGAVTTEACTAPADYVASSSDCDDATASISPVATELCNGVDDNCSMGVDEGCDCTSGETAPCGPSDGMDGILTTGACQAGTQRCIDGLWGECVGSVSPSDESCNGEDDDCDGAIDEGTTASCYGDGDGDGHGAGSLRSVCADATGGCPAGFSSLSGDCADGASSIHPNATESCNGTDDDCDSTVDEGVTVACYGDGDGDTYGTGAVRQVCPDVSGLCPAGFASAAGDCADGVSSVNPGASESCNDIDDDCDRAVDEAVTISCYSDGDGDGYGTGGVRQMCADASSGGCPTGFSSVAGDCEDGASAIHPDAAEACNGRDDDCDRSVDEGVTVSCYADADGDGHGSGVARELCPDEAGACPTNYSETGGDCNDSSSAVSPGAAETCNAVDDDCDSAPDDGFGCVRSSERSCTTTCGTPGIERCALDCSGYGTCRADVETCNGCDDDGDGAVDESFQCAAGSAGNSCVTACGSVGTYSCSSTCQPGVCAAASETCNGCDDDEDASVDEDFTCAQGASRSCTTACGTGGNQSCQGDCSGWRACRAASEACNGCDDDLNGAVDDGFDCRQGELLACTTACGTAGSRVCTDSCTIPAACYASGETCNYCDDNGTAGVSDEVGIATATHTRDFRTCSSVETAGVGGCSDFSATDATVLNATDSAAGSVMLASPLEVGYGPVEIEADVDAALGSSSLPADCWSLVIYEGDSTAVLGGGGPGCGVRLSRTGYAVEWMFYTGSFGGTQADRLRVRALTGDGVRNPTLCNGSFGTGCDFAVPSSQSLDSTRSPVTQGVRVRIHPEIPGSSNPDEGSMQVMDSFGSVVYRCFGSHTALTPKCPRQFEPGTLLQIGINGGTGGANARVTLDSSGSFNIPGGDIESSAAQTCP